MKHLFAGVTALTALLAGAPSLSAQAAQATAPAAPSPSGSPTSPAHGQIVQRILVKVNGEVFTQRDLEEAQINALQERNRQVNSPEDLNDAALRTTLAQITPEILLQAIDELIIIQRARELGFKVTEQQYKDAIESIKKENKIDDKTLLDALKRQGSSMELLREQIEHTALKQMVTSQEIMSHVSMTDEEARQYYERHQNEFLSLPQVTLREISVTVAAAPAGAGGLSFGASTDAASRAKIDAALDRVRKGEDFGAVAKDASQSATKDNGGLMSAVNVDDLSQMVRDATDKLKPGEVSDVIKTPRGYQFFRVESRTAQSVKPFEIVRKDIMNKVFEERGLAELKKYAERMRSQALIEWKDDNLKKLYEARVNGK